MQKLKNTILLFIILISIALVPTKKTDAQWFDVVQLPKELAADTIAFAVANQMISQFAAQTVNWINSGFQGNPSFVTDPGRFFLGIADNQVSRFLSGTALNSLCSPFDARVRIALARNYIQTTNTGVTSCSLSRIRDNYDAFIQDFNQGGWEGWFELTQNDANNAYGAYLSSQNMIYTSIGAQQKEYENQLDWGRGFLSFQRCEEVNEGGYGGVDCEIATPGSVIEENLNKALGVGQDRVMVADEINEVISALANQLVARALSSSGLLGSSAPSDDYLTGATTTPTRPPGSEGGTMTCNDDQTECEILITQPEPAEEPTICEIITRAVVTLQGQVTRLERELRELEILGCLPFDSQCRDNLRDKRDDVDDARSNLGLQLANALRNGCPL